MSSFAGYCQDCGKPVMHKTLFGTLHVCILPEQRVPTQLEANNRLSQLVALNPAISKGVRKKAPESPIKQKGE